MRCPDLALLDGRGSTINVSGYANPAFDALLSRAEASAEESSRRRTLLDAERVAVDDQALVPLYVYVSRRLISPRITGWTDNVRGVNVSRHSFRCAEFRRARRSSPAAPRSKPARRPAYGASSRTRGVTNHGSGPASRFCASKLTIAMPGGKSPGRCGRGVACASTAVQLDQKSIRHFGDRERNGGLGAYAPGLLQHVDFGGCGFGVNDETERVAIKRDHRRHRGSAENDDEGAIDERLRRCL
jgi:hypothetical protein